MIRLFVAALIFITVFSIYYDLSEGTIPLATTNLSPPTSVISVQDEAEKNNEEIQETDTLYVDVEVKAGDTVLTIAERIANKPIPVSINQLIEDFQLLNDGISPEKIQIGKVYKFPVY